MQDPSNPSLYEERGKEHLTKGRIEQALKDFDRGLQADPNNESLMLIKGKTLFNQQKFSESFAIYQEC
ncbi:MAG: tetratricopeptide repeat protein, partial [Bacteroidota bacterium]